MDKPKPPTFKEDMLTLINHEGFLLEQKTYDILNNHHSSFIWLERKKIIKNPNFEGEIDIFYEKQKYLSLIECKKTKYNWFFFKKEEQYPFLNYLVLKDQSSEIKTNGQHRFTIVEDVLAIETEGTDKIIRSNNKDISASQKNVDDALRQLLRNFEATYAQGQLPKRKVFPIIVTNAKLFLVEYEQSKVTQEGNLENYNSIIDQPYLVVNYNYCFLDETNGTITSDSHLKSVFIVNINKLSKLIHELDLF